MADSKASLASDTHLVQVERVVRPLAKQAVPLHERLGVAVRFVVVEDVVGDARVGAQVGHERHLTDARDFRLGPERALRVRVPSLLKVAQYDTIEGLFRHAYLAGFGRTGAPACRATEWQRARRTSQSEFQEERKHDL